MGRCLCLCISRKNNISRTYAILSISEAAFAEIHTKLAAAGYNDQFHDHDMYGRVRMIDMDGIVLQSESFPSTSVAYGRIDLWGIQVRLKPIAP
jgi:hypothetical protein